MNQPASGWTSLASDGGSSHPAADPLAWTALRSVVIAIPAKDEAERIGACLAALSVQRDMAGAPLEAGAFTVLVCVNNSTDDTAAEARRWAEACPHPIIVVEEALPPNEASAGGARRHAMELAADGLERGQAVAGVIMTTDADSCVAPTWVAATMAAIAQGADAVAGYIDADPSEIVRLGPAFLRRSRLEDRYLRALAEIDALGDPRPHNPWPTHRVSSGASLAVTLAAYRAIGGLPDIPVGEDAALTRALETHGFKVRHSMDVVVSTSCRLDGRAAGGAADTMRERHREPDAPCDSDLEPARGALRRALEKGRLRRAQATATPLDGSWARRLGLDREAAKVVTAQLATQPFLACWDAVAAQSPTLARRAPLRPSDLQREIGHAETILRRLRARRAPT